MIDASTPTCIQTVSRYRLLTEMASALAWIPDAEV